MLQENGLYWLQRIYKTQISQGGHDDESSLRKNIIGPVLDVFVSEDQGLTCRKRETLECRHHRTWQVLRGYVLAVELRNGHVNHQNSHQRLRARIRCLYVEDPQSPWPGSKIQSFASGDRLCFILKPHRFHHATDCNQGSRIPAWRASGYRLLSSLGSHWKSISAKDDGKAVGYTENSHEPKMISKAFTMGLRSEPHFHDVDGACHWQLVKQKFRNRFSKIEPNITAGQWLEQSPF